MKKAVMISIHPKWCELIANGKKTIEVRKTSPNLETPFKCYIYCTKGEKLWLTHNGIESKTKLVGYLLNCKIIGEFVCDKFYDITTPADYWSEYLFFAHHGKHIYDSQDLIANELLEETCLSMQNIIDYSQGKLIYAWHISDLKIYDKPKKLGEFKKFVNCNNTRCRQCSLSYMDNDLLLNCDKTIKKPPQSWCYVEELINETD